MCQTSVTGCLSPRSQRDSGIVGTSNRDTPLCDRNTMQMINWFAESRMSSCLENSSMTPLEEGANTQSLLPFAVIQIN